MDAQLCSPMTLLPPLVKFTPARPPGFETSPTLTFNYNKELKCTLPPSRCTIDMEVAPGEEEVPLCFEDLFLPGNEALLPASASSPPPSRAPQCKTLAGVVVCRTGGLSLRRTSTRLGAKGRAHKSVAYVEKAASAMVCEHRRH
ncbi:hypothetical protein D1007_48964 [Hordeum vulgare]|nr:hypothetical protein D1007_48964 [Hordeum vulgare]